MMWQLVRAEWLKTSRRPFDVGVVLVLFTTAAIAPVAIGAQALADSSRLDGARHMLGPAESLFTVMLLAPLLALVLGPLLAASAVGSEYGDGTWATVFSRTARRWPVLLAKLAVIAVTVTAVAAGAAMIWLIGCRVVGHFLPGAGPGVVPSC